MNPAIRAGLLAAALGLAMAAQAEDGLRPEISSHLKQAADLVQKGHAREAMAQIAEADAVSGKSAYETLTIERMRGSVAQTAGDNATAAKSFEAVVAANKLPPGEQLKMIEALGGIYYRLHDYARSATWVARYTKEGGSDPQMRALLAQDYYLAGDYANAAHELQAEAQAAESAGRVPAEDRLQMLLACQRSLKDSSGYVHTMELLVRHYPKKEYWSDFVHRVETRPGFADRLQIDLYRFKHAHGFLTQEPQTMEMAQLALQAGFPTLGKKVMDQGFASGLLGKGPQADREKRLAKLVDERLAAAKADQAKTLADARDNRDGTGLINLGMELVDGGDARQGLALAEEGYRKGNFRHPDDAKLRMGEIYLDQKQDGKAVGLLKAVGGSDGAADVAHLWLLQARGGN